MCHFAGLEKVTTMVGLFLQKTPTKKKRKEDPSDFLGRPWMLSRGLRKNGNNGHKLFIFHHENKIYLFADRVQGNNSFHILRIIYDNFGPNQGCHVLKHVLKHEHKKLF